MPFDSATQAKIDQLNSQKGQIDDQINALSDQNQRLQTQISNANTVEQLTSLQRQLDANQSQYNSLESQREAIEIQINQIASDANNQISPATTADKDQAVGNTTSESVPQTEKQTLSETETANINKTDSIVSNEDKANQVNTAPGVTATRQSDDDQAVLSSVLAPDSPEIDPNAQVDPIPNPLHAYPSYTYGFSLHVLAPQDWNNLNRYGLKGFRPTKTLISSASRYHGTRAETFTDDFYFDNFKMTTVIGLNSNTQGTNGIDMNFTIIEPYGLTLLNRLISLNSKELGCENYLELPYILEINFFGYDDQGKIANLQEHTKLIPIKIANMKIRAGVKGAEYEIIAIPFSHTAMMETSQATPANFEVTAKSVAEFFAPSKLSAAQQQSLNSAYKDSTRNYNKSQSNAVPGANSAESAKPRRAGAGAISTVPRKKSADVRETEASGTSGTDQTSVLPPASLNVTSYTSAYNAWQDQARAAGAQEFPDYIYFKFDRAIIENNKIVYEKKNPTSKTATRDPSAKNKNNQATANDPASQSKTPTTGPDFTRSIFNINAGTSITAILNQVLQNSDWILNQINPPTVAVNNQQAEGAVESNSVQEQSQKKPIQWFKIIPVVELGPYDRIRNKYSRTTTFYIKRYFFHNSKDNRANQSFPNGYIKDYQYIYTGKNQDIMSFDIDFNTLYFNAISPDLSKNEQLGSQSKDDSNQITGKIGRSTSNTVMPLTKVLVSDTAGNSMMNAGSDAKKKQANLIAESFLSSPRGDMLNLTLKIIGDPHFIKQDDVVSNPSQPDYNVSSLLSVNTNSIIMDASAIYCFVKFKTPVDIDETTGMLRTDGDFVESVFSGYYSVMTVDNEFSNGLFSQTLHLIRQFDQPDDQTATSGSSEGNKKAMVNRQADQNISKQMTSAANPGAETTKIPDSGSRTNELTEKSSGVITTPTSVTKNTSSSSTVASVTGGGVTERSIEMTPFGTVKEGSYKETFKPDSAGPTANDIKQVLGNDSGDGTERDDISRNTNLRNVAKNGPTEGLDF